MMKIYFYGGFTRQYEEGKQPEGAVEVVKVVEEKKAQKPAPNKARQPKNK